MRPEGKPEGKEDDSRHDGTPQGFSEVPIAQIYPYESSGRPRLDGTLDAAAVESGWWSWQSCFRRILGAVMCCMLPVAAIACADAMMRESGGCAHALEAIASKAVLCLFAVIIVGSVAAAVAMAGRSCRAGDADAPTMRGKAAERADLRMGVATPLTVGKPGGSCRRSAAWRIAGAGPLRCSHATIVRVVRLPAHVRSFFLDGTDNPLTNAFTANYYEIRFTDAPNGGRCVWSDAMWMDLSIGDGVTVYWYERSCSDGSRRIVVHDIADSRYAVDPAEHAVQMYHPRWFMSESARTMIEGEWGAARSLEWCAAYSSMTELRYARLGESWGGVIRVVGKGRKVTFPCFDCTVGHPSHRIGAIENSPERRFEPFTGVVEDVEVVPLFNRRFWCGFGYMALVRFSRMGSVRREWAFCDPGRADSYLGDDAVRLRVVPVGVGDRVMLWRAWDGLCVVEPRG